MKYDEVVVGQKARFLNQSNRYSRKFDPNAIVTVKGKNKNYGPEEDVEVQGQSVNKDYGLTTWWIPSRDLTHNLKDDYTIY